MEQKCHYSVTNQEVFRTKPQQAKRRRVSILSDRAQNARKKALGKVSLRRGGVAIGRITVLKLLNQQRIAAF